MSALPLSHVILVASPAPQDPPAPARSGVHELRLELDDASVRALCTDGARRVVLWHGAGSSADTWRPVLERLAVTARRHVPAERSGHDVQLDQPDLGADEIVRLVRAASR